MVIVQEDKSKSKEATVGGERRERRVSLGRLRGLYTSRQLADYVEMDGGIGFVTSLLWLPH